MSTKTPSLCATMGDHWLSDSTSILLYSVMFDADSLQPLIQKVLKLEICWIWMCLTLVSISVWVSKPTNCIIGTTFASKHAGATYTKQWSRRRYATPEPNESDNFDGLNISTQCNNTTVTLFLQLISELRADFHQRTQQQVPSHWILSYKLDASMALDVMADTDRF